MTSCCAVLRCIRVLWILNFVQLTWPRTTLCLDNKINDQEQRNEGFKIKNRRRQIIKTERLYENGSNMHGLKTLGSPCILTSGNSSSNMHQTAGTYTNKMSHCNWYDCNGIQNVRKGRCIKPASQACNNVEVRSSSKNSSSE